MFLRRWLGPFVVGLMAVTVYSLTPGGAPSRLVISGEAFLASPLLCALAHAINGTVMGCVCAAPTLLARFILTRSIVQETLTCEHCGYALRGLKLPRCPACGEVSTVP